MRRRGQKSAGIKIWVSGLVALMMAATAGRGGKADVPSPQQMRETAKEAYL